MAGQRPDILKMSEAELRSLGPDWMLAQLDRLHGELLALADDMPVKPMADKKYWED